MKKGKLEEKIVTTEMVDQLIKKHYETDSDKIELLLKQYVVLNRPEINAGKIVSDFDTGRNEMIKNVDRYEDELVRMLDLATVLSECRTENNADNIEQYISFLLYKNMEILPDIIEMIQLLKKI